MIVLEYIPILCIVNECRGGRDGYWGNVNYGASRVRFDTNKSFLFTALDVVFFLFFSFLDRNMPSRYAVRGQALVVFAVESRQHVSAFLRWKKYKL